MEVPLCKAVGEALLHTADSWIYNCDGGCFESTCTRDAWEVGPLLVIYQPHKSMREYDDMFATIFIKRKDKKAFTKKELSHECVSSVKTLLMDSFHDILKKSENRWTHPIKDDFKSLVQLKDDFRIEGGAVRFTFEIRGALDGCCGDRWEPHRLRAFIDNLHLDDAKKQKKGYDEAYAKAMVSANQAGVEFHLANLDSEFREKLKHTIKSCEDDKKD